MAVTGSLVGGGQVVPRRFVKFSGGKLVMCQPVDMEPGTAGGAPPVGVSQANSRFAAGTPWATLWTGATDALGVTVQGSTPIAADLDQELNIFDVDGDEVELEVATPTAADVDTGAGTLTAGG